MFIAFGIMSMAVAGMVMLDEKQCKKPNVCPELPLRVIPKVYPNKQKVSYIQLNDEKLILRYFPDYDRKVVTFQLNIPRYYPKLNWFALGFSDQEKLSNSDYCVYFSTEGEFNMKAAISDGFGKFVINNVNYCTNLYVVDDYFVQFSRIYDACTKNNYMITTGTTHMIWFYGENYPKLGGHGTVRLQLLNDPKISQIPPDMKSFDILNNDDDVPDNGLSNYCIIDTYPDWIIKKKHHLIKYEAKITFGNEDIVNRMELFNCQGKIEKYRGLCSENTTSLCNMVSISWAKNDGPFNYPPDVGLLVGGSNTITYFKLVIQYINQEYIKDSSGLVLYVTPKLRKYDAQFMEVGVEDNDRMIIPPGQVEFDLEGVCISDCLKTGALKGIYVFGSRFHTREIGKRVITHHYRNGIELPPLDFDNQYNSSYQPFSRQLVPVLIMPGDSLITKCTYTSKKLTEVTFAGSNPEDESCIDIIQYYPASNLRSCKSSVGINDLDDFFKFVQDDGVTDILDTNPPQINFKLIHPWTRSRLEFLENIYTKKQIIVQCLHSNGVNLFEKLNETNRETIVKVLPPPERNCPKTYVVHIGMNETIMVL